MKSSHWTLDKICTYQIRLIYVEVYLWNNVFIVSEMFRNFPFPNFHNKKESDNSFGSKICRQLYSNLTDKYRCRRGAMLKFCSSVFESKFFSGMTKATWLKRKTGIIIPSWSLPFKIFKIYKIQDTDFYQDLCIFEFEFFVTDKLWLVYIRL